LKFSAFKKDFIGAPFRKAFKPLAAGKKKRGLSFLGAGNPTFSYEIPYRLDEKFWVISAK
jgi:hypothetical protein